MGSNMMGFDGQVAVVTGAGHGLGRAYALFLAARGARVLVNDLGGSIHGTGSDQGPATRTAREIVDAGGVAEANFDTVATGASGRAIIAQALDTWGQVDIVVNNAGAVVSRGPIDENTDEQYQADLMVAAGGTFFVTRAVWRHMWDRDYGRIVNVSSSAFLGMRSSAGYPAAKGATWGLTRNLAHRAASENKDIKVNCVMPTAAARMTGLMGDSIAAGMAQYYPPESAAPAVGFLAHRDVPASGEMFVIGGDHMRRVFVGVGQGHQAEPGELSMERIRENFAAVMSTEGHIVARNTLDKVMLDTRVPWQDGVGTVF
ncbi:SDR family NAD(P)-dependent oxidoreductase [Nocardia grenadensis]|uniref:SDR family NAD(P)-dependent oxidoreductase n=1 Tax=Nocardia grenadensis TaxID=931537 RepID=UPI0007A47CE1|nr:SDR family NAD(P)-dependent oxidoreductase [Nocardia grenadensis]